MSVDVIGGAYDGAVVDTAVQPAWGWVGEYGNDHRIWRKPGGARELYRLVDRGAAAAYMHAHHTHAECSDCGALSALGDGCRLCGSALEPSSDRRAA